MTDILSEYKQRHGLPPSITPVTEGLLFLKSDLPKRLGAAVLVSSVSKSYQMCRECASYPGAVTMEVLRPQYFPHPLQLCYHVHFSHDFDIMKEVHANFGKAEPYSPVALPTARAVEEHVWEMFMETAQNNTSEMGSSAKNYLKARKPGRWLEEATMFATKYSNIFQYFYDSVYSPLLINRKYLLLAQ